MEKALKIGMIGVGIVGERFIKALQRHGKVSIRGIYDTHIERARWIAEHYKVPMYQDIQALLADDQIDVVYLAVPPKYHHSIAMDILAARKHIICEKPLANSITEAKEMWEKAEEEQVVHAMNFPTVYSAGFQQLNTYLDEGWIGSLRRVELQTYFGQWPRVWQQTDWISSREQGGFVREVFTHYVQMVQMLFGPITDIETRVEYPEDPSACETGIIATGKLQDGTPMLFNGFSNIGMEERISLTLYGTEGTLSFVNWRDLWVSQKGQKPVKVEIPDNDHLVELIEEVVQAIQHHNGRIVNFEEGYHAQVVIEKLLDRV